MKKLTIGGGYLKGKKIICPPGEIRPAMSVMREAIFQILDNELSLANNDNLKFLDLFAGSGLMGIEAVSHGFESAVSVEFDHLKWAVMQKNIALAPDNLRLAKGSAEKYLLKNTIPFQVIYADPPFRYRYKNDLIKKIVLSRACVKDSIVLIHMPKQENLIDSYDTFSKTDSRNYGDSSVHIFRNI